MKKKLAKKQIIMGISLLISFATSTYCKKRGSRPASSGATQFSIINQITQPEGCGYQMNEKNYRTKNHEVNLVIPKVSSNAPIIKLIIIKNLAKSEPFKLPKSFGSLDR